MKGKSLEQKDVQNENKMRGNVSKFLWTAKSGQIKMPAKSGQIKMPAARQA